MEHGATSCKWQQASAATAKSRQQQAACSRKQQCRRAIISGSVQAEADKHQQATAGSGQQQAAAGSNMLYACAHPESALPTSSALPRLSCSPHAVASLSPALLHPPPIPFCMPLNRPAPASSSPKCSYLLPHRGPITLSMACCV